MRGSPLEINGRNWTAEHDLHAGKPFSLSVDDGKSRFRAAVECVAVDDFDETMALPEKCVAHEYMDGDGAAVETAAVIPFGAEPRISRRIEYPGDGGIVKVTTDIDAPLAERLSVDKLSLKGDWSRVAVLEIPSDGALPGKLEWRPVRGEGADSAVSLDRPFLSMLLESADGAVLEISTGFDLWRWGAGDAEPSAEFALSPASDGLVLERVLSRRFDTEERRPKTRVRLTWSLAWWLSSMEPEPLGDAADLLLPDGLPDSARAAWNGGLAETPCHRSKPFRSALRKATRRAAGGLEEGRSLRLSGIEPVLCDAPAHLERPGKKRLIHWTHRELIDFHFWANRHLRPKDAGFALSAPENGIFDAFPSFKRMETPTALDAVAVERKK